MKRSQLTLTGETYRLTPDSWGNTSIMVDEDVVAQSTGAAFGIESCEPDGDLDSVEIATDGNGKFFAILEPFTRAGKTYNENRFRPCQNPADATHGSASIYGIGWDIFEDEAE